MAKLTLSDVTNLQNESSVIGTINANSDLIEAALEKTLSRDGTSPNQMLADLDMNSHRILNLPQAVSDTEPVRYREFNEASNTTLLQSYVSQAATSAQTAQTAATAANLVSNTISSLTAISVKAYNASGSSSTTTTTALAGVSSIVLSSALDFSNGQGILINHGGAATSVAAPTGIAAAAVNRTGVTSYDYKLASVDTSGGVSAASAVVTVANGYATLGTLLNDSLGRAVNRISWTIGTGTPMGTAIWRSKNSGPYEFIGIFEGTAIADGGITPKTIFYISSIPPVSALPKWHVTNILSGAGTTTITLGSALVSAVTSTEVWHDDTVAINAAIADNTALYFPQGTYNVRGLDFGAFMKNVSGEGPSVSIINAIGTNSNSFLGGVSATSGYFSEFNMSGLKIMAYAEAAYDAFTLYRGLNASITNCIFAGKNAVFLTECVNCKVYGNNITGWWDIGIKNWDSVNSLISGNSVGPISGHAGTPPGTPITVNYVWGTGIHSREGSQVLISHNNITPFGGIFGINVGTDVSLVSDNSIRFSTREAIAVGASNILVKGNQCFWESAGNGNNSSYDFGMSIADDVRDVANVTISDNLITNPSVSGIGVWGYNSGHAVTGITIKGNHFYGTNQTDTSGVHSAAIEISGSNVSAVLVANNTFYNLGLYTEWWVKEQNNGYGMPTYTVVGLQTGSPGTSGRVDITHVGSYYEIAPASVIGPSSY